MSKISESIKTPEQIQKELQRVAVANIHYYLSINDLNQSQLCKLTGIKDCRMSALLHNKQKFYYHEVCLIAKALRISLNDLREKR